MRIMTTICSIVLVCVTALPASETSGAGTAFRLLTMPSPWSSAVTITAGGETSERVGSDAETSIGFRDVGLGSTIRLLEDGERTLLADVSGGYRVIDHDAPLVYSDTGNVVPGHLERIGVGISGRLIDSGKRSWVASLTISSNSDRAFDSMDEVDVTALAGVNLPQKDQASWLLGLFYSRTIQFPLPLVAYSWQPKPGLYCTVGLPLLMVMFRSRESKWDGTLRVIAVNIAAEAGYRPFPPLRFYGLFTNQRWSGYIADRAEADQQLSYDAWRLAVGTSWSFSRTRSLALEFGYEIERELVETDGWSFRGQEEEVIDLDPAGYLRLQMQWSF